MSYVCAIKITLTPQSNSKKVFAFRSADYFTSTMWLWLCEYMVVFATENKNCVSISKKQPYILLAKYFIDIGKCDTCKWQIRIN